MATLCSWGHYKIEFFGSLNFLHHHQSNGTLNDYLDCFSPFFFFVCFLSDCMVDALEVLFVKVSQNLGSKTDILYKHVLDDILSGSKILEKIGKVHWLFWEFGRNYAITNCKTQMQPNWLFLLVLKWHEDIKKLSYSLNCYFYFVRKVLMHQLDLLPVWKHVVAL